MSEVKIDQPRKFWLQQGSFATVVVENENSNPTWVRKPFQVIETFALELLTNQLQSENKHLREKLNTCKNDYWFMINLLEKYSTNKDEAIKDCIERMKFRKPMFKLTKQKESE